MRKMQKPLFLLLAWCMASTAFAQLKGSGFYRVQNVNTQRYITFASKDVVRSGTDVDMKKALITKKGFENVVSEPGSVVYMKNAGGSNWDLVSQGIDSYQLTGLHLTVTDEGSNTYSCSGKINSQGVSAQKTLSDSNGSSDRGYLVTEGSNKKWYFKPISISGNEYFGIKPTVEATNGYYRPFYASFAFSPGADNMKIYYVKQITASGVAVITEVNSGTIPAGMPVIIKCASASYSNNRINILSGGGAAVSGNNLTGTYFTNTVAYDPDYHRVLSIASDGSLAFVKETNRSYLNANEAVLRVPKGYPDVMKVMTEEEFAKDEPVTISIYSYEREYGEDNPNFEYKITGTPRGIVTLECTADKYAHAGTTHTIRLKDNCLSNSKITVEEGTLTITKAKLTARPADVTRMAGKPNPTTWQIDYSGFKNSDNASVLTTPITVTCTADASSPVGTYPITLSGGDAQDYEIQYEEGHLYVMSPYVQAVDETREYGDPNPQFHYTPENMLDGTPSITCAADEKSPAGEYPIVISRGTVTNEGVEFLNGTLTVTKARLVVKFSQSSFTIKQGEKLPDYMLTYSGWKNDDDESILDALPTIEIDPNDMSVGNHKLRLKEGTSSRYRFVLGSDATLKIEPGEPLVVTAKDITRVYGDPNPAFTYSVEGAAINGEPAISCKDENGQDVTASTPVGTYTITVSKGTISNSNDSYVSGTLTILPAPLTISAGTYSRKQGEENPDFTAGLTYSGFKLNETEDVLTDKPTVSCAADKDSEPGEYDVVVSGAKAQNYDISYVNGKLVVSEADELVVVAENYTREYGEANPEFAYTVSGAEAEGTPEISCEATATTPVGTYDIVVGKGTLTNYKTRFTNGTLTITPATLKVSVADCEREEGQENPAFTIQYEGWKNGETESVLLTKPTATCAADKDSKEGEYPIILGGGEAQNYVFEYTNGVLTVKVPAGINALIARGQTFDVYTPAGVLVRRAATNLNGLPRGIYIVNGKKAVKK